MTFETWIETNVTSDSIGKCAEITLAMCKAFPELKRVRGHYYDFVWAERAHWWCVDPNGIVIDPTAAQFPSKGLGFYDEHVKGDPEPTGKCMNCGAYCFNEQLFCCDQCERETMHDYII